MGEKESAILNLVFTFKAGFFFRFHPRPHYPIDQLNACEFHNSCDPEEGVKQAQKLKAELEAALSPFNVQVWGGGGGQTRFTLVGPGGAKKRLIFFTQCRLFASPHTTHTCRWSTGWGSSKFCPSSCTRARSCGGCWNCRWRHTKACRRTWCWWWGTTWWTRKCSPRPLLMSLRKPPSHRRREGEFMFYFRQASARCTVGTVCLIYVFVPRVFFGSSCTCRLINNFIHLY